MESRAKLVGVSNPDWRNKRKWVVAFEVEANPESIEELEKKELKLTAKPYRQRRSLNANAYMWVLTDKIAEKTNETVDEAHKRHILTYSHTETIDDMPVTVTVRRDVDMDKVEGYWRHYYDSSDGKWRSYRMIKRSSHFDTKEMSNFLERIVEEAKELGIDTATPEELERMLKLYEQNQKRHN